MAGTTALPAEPVTWRLFPGVAIGRHLRIVTALTMRALAAVTASEIVTASVASLSAPSFGLTPSAISSHTPFGPMTTMTHSGGMALTQFYGEPYRHMRLTETTGTPVAPTPVMTGVMRGTFTAAIDAPGE